MIVAVIVAFSSNHQYYSLVSVETLLLLIDSGVRTVVREQITGPTLTTRPTYTDDK